MTFDLPTPPSINAYWQYARNRVYVSKAGKQYQEAVRSACLRQRVKMLRGPVIVTVVWRRGRRAGDLDNRLKLALDALRYVAFEDDAKVIELHAYRQDDKSNPGMTVTVEPATEARRKAA